MLEDWTSSIMICCPSPEWRIANIAAHSCKICTKLQHLYDRLPLSWETSASSQGKNTFQNNTQIHQPNQDMATSTIVASTIRWVGRYTPEGHIDLSFPFFLLAAAQQIQHIKMTTNMTPLFRLVSCAQLQMADAAGRTGHLRSQRTKASNTS